MKAAALLLALLAAAPLLHATRPPPADARARDLVAELNLAYLPDESGFFSFIGRSDQSVTVDGRALAAQSRIYYMLTAEEPVNFLHWLASDDTHILLEGGPVDYFIFHPDGAVEQVSLGPGTGQQRIVAIPGNCRKALRLHPGAGYVLLVNVLSPEWTPDRVKVGAGADFLHQYTGKAPWATEAFLRELIGPNFR